MTQRLMFVHAHPDDESSKGAATAARYLDDGAEVTLVTCTGGEAGDVLNPNVDPIEPERMAEIRAQELADAVAAIGFTRTYMLGYVDSGYHEDPDAIPPGTFARVPIDEAAAKLAAIIRRERPHVVVTYPEDGGYPHPDHIANHRVTMRAIDVAAGDDPVTGALEEHPAAEEPGWRVRKVYASLLFPRERLTALHEALEATDPSNELLAHFAERKLKTPPTVPDARIECGAQFERRDTALRAHVSQIDPAGRWFQLPRDLERTHYPYEAYTLLASTVPVNLPEDDFFAGLAPGDR